MFYSKIGGCDNPNFRDAGLAVALIDKWIIDYMTEQKLIVPDNVIVVGQSAGGWAALALSSQNLPAVRASLRSRRAAADASAANPTTIARPTSWSRRPPNSAHRAHPDAVDLHRERHLLRTGLIEANARAYTGAGGNAEYHLLPPFGSDGHFLIDSPDSIPLWAPLVDRSWTSTDELVPTRDGDER